MVYKQDCDGLQTWVDTQIGPLMLKNVHNQILLFMNAKNQTPSCFTKQFDDQVVWWNNMMQKWTNAHLCINIFF